VKRLTDGHSASTSPSNSRSLGGVVRTGRLIIVAGLLAAFPATAESLADAIAAAYQSNPTLQSQRALLMSADEGYVQARAALGPTVSLEGTATHTQTRFGYLSPTEANNGNVQLTLSQSLYSGGRAALNVSAAEAHIAAAREVLRIAEGNVILAVVQAYADVIRDAAALGVREQNVQVLTDEVKESHAREHAGEITRTDVAQAETQLAGERALLSTSRGQLQVSRAAYATVVGQNPGALDPYPPLPGLPHTIDDAFSRADRDSPELLQARFTEIESEDRVRVARAVNRPTILVGVVAGYSGPITPFSEQAIQRAVTGQVTVTQPLFTNGLNGSLIRQALDQNTSDKIAIETSRRSVVQTIANAWNQMLVSGDNVAFQRENVRAAQVAFTGMRIEQRAGQRATLDVLITEQNLVNAQLLLLAAQHDQYVAEAALLRSIGRLEGAYLIANLPIYDPAAHLRRVSRRGVAPWTPITRAIDSLGAPGVGRRPAVGPSVIAAPAALAPASPPPAGALIETLPTSPSSAASASRR